MLALFRKNVLQSNRWIETDEGAAFLNRGESYENIQPTKALQDIQCSEYANSSEDIGSQISLPRRLRMP